MHTMDDISNAVNAVRQALEAGRGEADALQTLGDLAESAGGLSPVDAVDLLERAATFGRLASVRQLHQMVGEFAYRSWALALSLRCAHEDVARDLLARGVDLLGPVVQPRGVRTLIPNDGTFTRFDLTRAFPTLFLNPKDPTVSTEVFEGFGQRRQLAGAPYAAPVDLAATCELVARLAEEGLFDQVVFDDLFRAAMVKAWHALRHDASLDEATARTCLSLGARLLELHERLFPQDDMPYQIMGKLIVPKTHPSIVAFVCERAPQVFFKRLEDPWLQDDTKLVRSMVYHLSPIEDVPDTLVRVLARNGFVAELKVLGTWPGALTEGNLSLALDEAARAGHAETAAWILTHLQDLRTAHGSASGDSLADLFL